MDLPQRRPIVFPHESLVIPPNPRFEAFLKRSGTGRRGAIAAIDLCCDEMLEQGIPLVRGSCFDFTGPDPLRPVSCSWFGAFLWCSGNVNTNKPVTVLWNLLRVDFFWYYRFSIGWHNWLGLTNYTEGKDGELIPHDDNVSWEGMKLSKEKTQGA